MINNGDLAVTATTTGFEVSLVLRKAPLVAPEIRLPLNLAGMTVAQDAKGGLTLTGVDGATIVTSPAPLMFSAARDAHAGEPTQTKTVASAVENGPGGAVLVLRPDFGFLSDPATVYPVTVDPGSTLSSDLSTHVASDFPNQPYDSDTTLKVGTYNGGTSVHRSFIRFNDSAIKGAQVTSAVLNVYETWSWSCTPGAMWVDGAGGLNPGATWNTQPSMDGRHWYNGSFYGGYSGCLGTAGIKSLDITGLAQSWSTDGLASPETLALRATNETDSNQWKKFNSDNTTTPPSITVTYNAPAVPSAPQNVAAGPGNSAATITWTQPAYLGNPQMTAYYIYNYLWNGSGWTYLNYNTCAYPCTSTLVSGLANGSTYASNVFSWNSAGLGGYGQAIYTPAGPPTAPLNVAATAGNASTTVRWSAPTWNGGMALDFYLLDAVDLGNNNLQFLNTACGTCTSGNVAGLTNGHVYAIYVWAHNALAGYGPYTLSNDIQTGAVDPMAGAGQRPGFTQQTFQLTDRTAATVNVGTGNLAIATTDIVLPAVGGSLPLGRVFNSMAEAPGSSIWYSTNFGYTWRFNQAPDVRLVLNNDGSVAYDSPSGNVATFAANGPTFTTPPGLDANLIRNGDGSYTLTANASAEKQIFGADGNLVYDIDRNGNTLTFAYPDGRRVMTISGTAGTAGSNSATITTPAPVAGCRPSPKLRTA